MMKKITLLVILLTITLGYSQNNVTADPAASWVGYMNWFDNPSDPTPDCGGFCQGQGWAIPDLKTVIGASNITLQPNYNTYNATDSYWADGAIGNKIMEASTYVEPGASFNGVDLTFSGSIVSNTLDSGYLATFWIKALDPSAGYSDALGGSKVITLPVSGNFTVSATGVELALGLIVQYGFTIYGLNANPVDEAAFGSVVVQAATLGINDFEIAGLNIYPNPAQDNWTVKTKNINMSSIKVYDILGKNVLSLSPSASEVKINAAGLKAGLYFAQIKTANGVSSLKLVKQ